MARRALITGICGQDGAYLARLLLDRGYEVVGTTHAPAPSLRTLAGLGVLDRVELRPLDLRNGPGIDALLASGRFDEVYNLAGESFVGSSFRNAHHIAEVNGLGPMRLLEALLRQSPRTRFYQASSSEMFGLASTWPQNETTPFAPRNPYGAAKLLGHWATTFHREAHGLFACSGILFNHESPFREPAFVTAKVVKGLCALRRGHAQGPLELGNLNAGRDWGFAGDYVEGMWRMLQAPEPGDYVLATGVRHTVRQLVEACAAALDLRLEWTGDGLQEQGVDALSGEALVVVSKAFFRPDPEAVLVGDAAKARSVLGWRAKVGFEALIAMMVRAELDGAPPPWNGRDPDL